MLEPIDKGLVDVIAEAYRRSFSVQSDFARRQSDYVAMAASMGLISTRVHKNVFSRDWRPTIRGLQFVEQMNLEDED